MAEHAGGHMGGIPRKQTQPSRWGVKGEHLWASSFWGFRVEYTRQSYEGNFLVCVIITWSQGRAGRETVARSGFMALAHLVTSQVLTAPLGGCWGHRENTKFGKFTIYLAKPHPS